MISKLKKFDINMVDRQTISFLINGMLPEFKLKLKEKNFSNIDDLVKYCIVIEQNNFKSTYSSDINFANSKRIYPSVNSSNNGSTTKVRNKDQRTRFNSFNKKLSRKPDKSMEKYWTKNGQPICMNCKKVGHFKKDCRSWIKYRNSKYQKNNNHIEFKNPDNEEPEILHITSSNSTPITIPLRFGKILTDAVIDSGSGLTLISLEAWKKSLKNDSLVPYDGPELIAANKGPLEIVGTVKTLFFFFRERYVSFYFYNNKKSPKTYHFRQ